MSSSVSVYYPKGVKFNMKYYIDSHMPLVVEKWGQYGIKKWTVVSYDDDADYKVQAILHVDDVSAFDKAASSKEAEEVFGDIPNFSDKQPIVAKGKVEGSG